ncbi:hypothetical protein C7B64_17200 [Merismopedia glauca CCAP 1448/3]|uniref:Uncharacterized protein n=2 Tax=Merismopedia TaxID=53402 RepID=A0A2T1C0G2_9CYAN|nr:hypothetical protein C7B64_17200 [Merismopedia glauca CCAP 1448/3]
MSIGESIVQTIKAKNRWNDTNIIITEGETYRFQSSGLWKDMYKTCDANGYTSTNILLHSTEWLRRFSTANWFALIGAIDHNKQSFFAIGNEATITIKKVGLFSCFANDVSFMYWNNSGEIQLAIKRLD